MKVIIISLNDMQITWLYKNFIHYNPARILPPTAATQNYNQSINQS